MLHPSFYKTMINYLLQLGSLLDPPFEGNPDYIDYWALFTANPSLDSFATVEATYGGYARQHYARTPTIWQLLDGPPAYASNRQQITFPPATSGAGQVLTHWGWLYPDIGSGGASYGLVVSGALEIPVTVALGQSLIYPANAFRVQSPF
ncbi:MAG: hypothetical protein EKK48_30175 [Candidatus Melainabacteria bacterium]|nr:MAG: hypothetical protein EKK48_30175 [Candidatus Melainabacteria bacterium]